MPRRLLKRLQKKMPGKVELSREWYLRPFNALLHDPALWSLHRRGVTKAVAIGLFFAMLPIVGQMVLAGLLALWIRVNLPVAIISTWVTNPVTFVPVYYSAYKLGAVLLGQPAPAPERQAISVELITSQLAAGWKPLFLGSALLAVVVAVLGYLILNMIWRITLAYRFRNRRRGRSATS